MPKKIAPLSALQVKAAKLRIRLRLFLMAEGFTWRLVVPSFQGRRNCRHRKSWKMKYRHQGKACKISIGKYPDVSLEEARLRRQGIKAQLAQGISQWMTGGE